MNSSSESFQLEESDVEGFMIDSGPKLSSEHDGLSWTSVRIGQLPIIGANWTRVSVLTILLIF